ncbi:MAG: hypothetical protein IJ677_02770, partial [Alphaproteobacteria bacterium]|nr:hypothetical protein [Alphaproteobacteria bacterium]
MNKKILIALVAGIAVVSSMIYIFSKNDEKTVQSKELHQVADVNNIDSVKQISGAEDLLKKEVEPKINKQIEKVKTEQEKYTASVDMNKWQYNAQDGVFYQTGIVYTQIPANLKYQKMALFVPEKYMTCIKKTDTFFSCKKNVSEYIGKYNADKAPILFEINSPDFAATSALSEYKNYSKYIKAGIVYVHIGFRGIESGAPYGVTDIKAAVKYLRRNSEHIAGNVNSIFALGIREGGMLAAVLGASGNAKSYMPYLQKIGALKGVDDNINGVILFNPISGLDTANEALEWLLGEERKDMTDEQRKISETMAKEYANYVNKAGFIDANGRALTLQYSKKGIYKEGTYYDYIKNVIAKSLQNFIKTHSFPFAIPKSWEISEDKAIAQDNI